MAKLITEKLEMGKDSFGNNNVHTFEINCKFKCHTDMILKWVDHVIFLVKKRFARLFFVLGFFFTKRGKSY